VWTSAAVRARAADFVCAADEVWRLQRGSEADCIFFQRVVTGGKRITDRGTRQGTWILSPGGEVLARTNTRDVDKVLATFEEGLAAWNELPDERRRLPADAGLEPQHRWESSRPDDGLILERIGRELNAEGLAGERHPSWNRDFAWFRGEEVSDRGDWSGVARRLARFHLVDNVRGQTLPYADEEVQVAELSARAVATDGTRVTLELEGRTVAVAEGPWLLGESLWKPENEHPHGIECALVGRAVYDRGAGRVEALELVAVGRRWGRTVMNGRGREGADAPGLIAFYFRRALEPEATVAPTFIELYDADWVAHPPVPTWRDSPAEVGLTR
jgi:hypothetical protein